MFKPIKLIIGLQNPGSAYEKTRHNAGGWFVDALVKRLSTTMKSEKKLHSFVTTIDNDATQCRVALPTTYMNHSGQPVQALCRYFQIKSDEVLVVHDELDLEAGRIKLKSGGGHGGHNGLKDIINKLGSNDFHRLRIGIGHPGHKDMVHNYVLSKPSIQDRQFMMDAIERGIVAIPKIISGDIPGAMNQLNG